MSFDPASLPREPDQLIEMVLSLQGENDKLRAIVATLTRALFGARSERLDANAAQLPLGLGDLAAIPVEPEPTPKPQPADRPTRPLAMRNIGGLPKHLPREEIIIEPEAQTCPCCQGKLHLIGEDVSEMLDVIPAVIRVQRIRRPPLRLPRSGQIFAFRGRRGHLVKLLFWDGQGLVLYAKRLE